MKKKIISAISILTAVVALSTACGTEDVGAERTFEALQKKNLQDTISVNGIVKSNDSKNVYCSLNYPVNEVIAEVGDVVKIGDVLCLIDGNDLKDQIAIKEATMKSSNINTYYQLSQSEKQYNEAKNNLENGTNTEIANAAAAVKSAELDLNSAKNKYNDLQISLNNSSDDEVVKTGNELSTLGWNMQCAKNDYMKLIEKNFPEKKAAIFAREDELSNTKNKLTEAKNVLNAARMSQHSDVTAAAAKVTEAHKDYDSAVDKFITYLKTEIGDDDEAFVKRYMVAQQESSYEELEDKLNDLITQTGGETATLKSSLDAAQLNYDKAVLAYESTQRNAESQLESLKDTMEKDQQTISNEPQLLELDSLKKKLADCNVTAPINGTITSVTAKEGVLSNGILFTIDDTETLKITANVKEYDIGNIELNQKVIIKSEATGDTEYDGIISKIAPSATQTQNGTGTETNFEVEITVTSKNTKLLIGMSTKMKIVINEKDSVYSIRYDSVSTNKDGQDIIYVADDNGEGAYTLREIPVTLGMETDLEVEIQSDELTEGMKIITDINNLQAGQIIKLAE